MSQSYVSCTNCRIVYLKENKYINENLKLSNNSYCSSLCQYSFKSNKKEFMCENLRCNKKFKRQPSDISSHNYCSRSCAAIINNTKFPKNVVVRNCYYCGVRILQYRKYCSSECRSNALTVSKQEVVRRIRKFYERCRRIPVKREMWGIYKPARKFFGTWNNAIEAAGFKPNPVMFADNCVAHDGHFCNSIAEKTIDDYLYEKGIEHERSISYPEGSYTADFRIGNKLIEYFGLAGEHKRYDELRRIKQKIAKSYRLNLIEIYPQDLYPFCKLDNIFTFGI